MQATVYKRHTTTSLKFSVLLPSARKLLHSSLCSFIWCLSPHSSGSTFVHFHFSSAPPIPLYFINFPSCPEVRSSSHILCLVFSPFFSDVLPSCTSSQFFSEVTLVSPLPLSPTSYWQLQCTSIWSPLPVSRWLSLLSSLCPRGSHSSYVLYFPLLFLIPSPLCVSFHFSCVTLVFQLPLLFFPMFQPD